MTEFSGFQSGCSGEAERGSVPYVSHIAHFQKEGEKLEADQAGQVTPDAIRVVPVDDYGGSRYIDTVFAFSEEAAEVQLERGDARVPEDQVLVVNPEDLEEINHECRGCAASEGKCAVLQRMAEMAIEK